MMQSCIRESLQSAVYARACRTNQFSQSIDTYIQACRKRFVIVDICTQGSNEHAICNIQVHCSLTPTVYTFTQASQQQANDIDDEGLPEYKNEAEHNNDSEPQIHLDPFHTDADNKTMTIYEPQIRFGLRNKTKTDRIRTTVLDATNATQDTM